MEVLRMSRYYSIRNHADLVLTWSQAKSRPIDAIMKLDGRRINADPERNLVSGRCQYPKDNYVYVSLLEEWEYDMLDAFGVPHADDEVVNGLIKIFSSM